jgi:hypothetical protein
VITIEELVVGDEPAAWTAAGFTSDDGIAAIGAVRVRLYGPDAGLGVTGWALRGATVANGRIDGLPTTSVPGSVTDPPEREGERPNRAGVGVGAAHANGAVLIDHVVVATPDWQRTIDALVATGMALRRERDAGRGMRQGFFRTGEVIVEVVGPTERAGDGPAGFFGLAITVADLDATKARLGDALSDPKPAVQPGRRIATLRHRDLGLSTAIAFMSAG